MDKDRIYGPLQRAVGAVKKFSGRLLGDRKLERDGEVDRAEGEVKSVIGQTKDVIRDAVDKG